VDALVVVLQLVPEPPDAGQQPVDATPAVSSADLGGVPAPVPQVGQATNDDAKTAGSANVVISV